MNELTEIKNQFAALSEALEHLPVLSPTVQSRIAAFCGNDSSFIRYYNQFEGNKPKELAEFSAKLFCLRKGLNGYRQPTDEQARKLIPELKYLLTQLQLASHVSDEDRRKWTPIIEDKNTLSWAEHKEKYDVDRKTVTNWAEKLGYISPKAGKFEIPIGSQVKKVSEES